MTDAPALRLKWQKTWPDSENDFSGRTQDSSTGSAGRIYAKELYDPPRFWWFWYANGCIKGTDMWMARNGYEDTAREAAARVEEIWFAALDRHAEFVRSSGQAIEPDTVVASPACPEPS